MTVTITKSPPRSKLDLEIEKALKIHVDNRQGQIESLMNRLSGPKESNIVWKIVPASNVG